MPYIIYADCLKDFAGNYINEELIRKKFTRAIEYSKEARNKGLKAAYMFIDPLMDSFEAANKFYFNIFGCEEVSNLNVYRTGCGPIQAVADAYMLLSQKIFDIVFIFGFEPLATLKTNIGKESLSKAMDIYEGITLPEAYNRLAQYLLKVLYLTEDQFFNITDALYENYKRTYKPKREIVHDRTVKMSEHNANLFTLTDCSNPYVDFAGGVIIATGEAAKELGVHQKDVTKLKDAGYIVVKDGPDSIETIAGTEENIYPHLNKVYTEVCLTSGVDFNKEFKDNNALLE